MEKGTEGRKKGCLREKGGDCNTISIAEILFTVSIIPSGNTLPLYTTSALSFFSEDRTFCPSDGSWY